MGKLNISQAFFNSYSVSRKKKPCNLSNDLPLNPWRWAGLGSAQKDLRMTRLRPVCMMLFDTAMVSGLIDGPIMGYSRNYLEFANQCTTHSFHDFRRWVSRRATSGLPWICSSWFTDGEKPSSRGASEACKATRSLEDYLYRGDSGLLSGMSWSTYGMWVYRIKLHACPESSTGFQQTECKFILTESSLWSNRPGVECN